MGKAASWTVIVVAIQGRRWGFKSGAQTPRRNVGSRINLLRPMWRTCGLLDA